MILFAHIDPRMVLAGLALFLGTYLCASLGVMLALLRKKKAALLFSMCGLVASLPLAIGGMEDDTFTMLPGLGLSLVGLIVAVKRKPRPVLSPNPDSLPISPP